jgi:mannosyltransferase OCH1-like enzyme
MNIPKIIHHIAPANKSQWHPIWDKCYPTWQKHFPEFEHKMWNDENLEQIVEKHLPEYYNLFNDLPVHMMKIDFMKFALLYIYGGFYIDLDVFCYKNFYDELYENIYLLEACYGNEPIENAIMISSKNNKFILECMKLCNEKFYQRKKNKNIDGKNGFTEFDQLLILKTTGPHLVGEVYKNFDKSKIGTLSGILYNNHGLSYHPEYRTKHMLTGIWGKEIIDLVGGSNENKKNNLWNNYLSDISKYVNLQNLSIENFNFYKDYTNDGFCKESILQKTINNEFELKYG